MVDNKVNDHSIVEITDEDRDVIARINGNSETSREHKNQVELTVSSLRGKLHRQPPFPACSCIFRVPKVLRRHNEKAFVPNLVSIGPFHHGDENLQVMEEIKRWYLHSLLERKPTPKTSLECFVEEIGRIEQKHRDCYGEKFDIYSGNFVEMMVLDGCFIIELLRRCVKLVPWDDDDPLEYTSWMLKVLKNDLFLLENQLPWNVLERLFDLTKVNDDHSLLALALKFFESSVFNQTPQIKEGVQTKHLLDAVRESLISLHKPKSTERRYWEPIPTVTELLQAGVKFKSKSKEWNNMLDITFKNGVMEIPPIDIESNAESHFRNLIAYEHCDPDIAIFNITSYAVILDNLIQSSEDAEFLIQKRIITTILSKEDLACFFNGLYKDTIPSHFSYVELTEKVNARQLWKEQTLAGKPGGFFVSTGTQGGGQETTLWTAITQLAHHGMLFVPVGYTFGAGMFKMDSVRGGSPYGAGVFAGDGTRGASETELALAEHQGKYMASVVKKLAA